MQNLIEWRPFLLLGKAARSVSFLPSNVPLIQFFGCFGLSLNSVASLRVQH